METAENLRHLWDIDPASIYLNHGSFGPAPEPVRAARAEWTRRLERQPMRLFCREMEEELEKTTIELARFLRTKPDRIVLIDNATVAMNIVAETVSLEPEDEVLLTDHEYGAVRNIWSRFCQKSGAILKNVELPFPPSDSAVTAAIRQAITPRTKLIVISHVTSATACRLPVREVCQLAAEHGILVAVDGPHAMAMLDVDLEEIGCDFYCASCHKWMCASLGSGFLWVHPRHQASVKCPIVSWGGSIAGRPASWKDGVQWLGTRDPAPLLSISAAIRFFTKDRLKLFRQHAHGLITEARRELLRVPGVQTFCTPNETDYVSMCAIELPQPPGWKPGYHGHPDPLQVMLRDKYGIEVLTGSWNGHRFIRFSAHLYTTQDHIRTFVSAVQTALQ